MIGLTDEEIETIVRKEFPIFELNEEDEGDRKEVINALLKAQLKKVVKWLESKESVARFDKDERFAIYRDDWQALLEEVKE